MYISICVYIYLYMHVNIYVCVYIYIYIHIMHIHIYICVCIPIYYIYTQTYIFTYIYIYGYMLNVKFLKLLFFTEITDKIKKAAARIFARRLLRLFYLFAAAAGLAVSAALFCGLARCGINFSAVTAFGRFAAIGTGYRLVEFFNQLFELLAAFSAYIL